MNPKVQSHLAIPGSKYAVVRWTHTKDFRGQNFFGTVLMPSFAPFGKIQINNTAWVYDAQTEPNAYYIILFSHGLFTSDNSHPPSGFGMYEINTNVAIEAQQGGEYLNGGPSSGQKPEELNLFVNMKLKYNRSGSYIVGEIPVRINAQNTSVYDLPDWEIRQSNSTIIQPGVSWTYHQTRPWNSIIHPLTRFSNSGSNNYGFTLNDNGGYTINGLSVPSTGTINTMTVSAYKFPANVQELIVHTWEGVNRVLFQLDNDGNPTYLSDYYPENITNGQKHDIRLQNLKWSTEHR